MTNVIQPVPGAKVISLDGTEIVDILGGSVKGVSTTQAIANLVTAGNTSGNSHVIGNLTVDGNSTLTGATTQTGNLTTGNIATTGLLAVTGNVTVSANETITGNATVTGNLTVTTNETIGGTLGVTGLFSPTLMPKLPSSNPTPTGTVVGNATAITLGVVKAADAVADTGLVLPTAPAAGSWAFIINGSGNTTKIYPDASATINAIGSNGPISLTTLQRALFVATSTTQWYTFPLVPS